MKSFDYYHGTDIVVPARDEFTHIFAYKNGKVIFDGNAIEYSYARIGNGILAGVKDFLIEKSLNEDAFKEMRAAKIAERSKRREEFIADLTNETGLGEKGPELINMILDRHESDLSAAYDLIVDIASIIVK